MLKIIAIVIAIVVAAFLVYVATKPAEFRIERSQAMKGPPTAVFALINDLHGFNTWNPFALAEPSLRIVYSGAEVGPEAAYNWDSNGRAGQGRMEIVAATPPSVVTMRLEFTRPFQASNVAEFTVTPDGDTTKVTWAMIGRNGYLQNVMGTLFNMDKMVGGQFAQGLLNLKAIVERPGPSR